MGQSSITMFTNDSGAAGGPTAYVQDVFQDMTDTPSTNSGWSSTISSNPLNNLYGNDDVPRYGPKTLWIQDLVLEPNRQFWINGEPTYRIVWNEPYPSAQGYVWGNISFTKTLDQRVVTIKTSGDGFGVGGVFARVMFLMLGNTTSSGNATGTVSVDGVNNTTTVDWSSLSSNQANNTNMYAASVHANSNEAYNIHDFRLTANQSGGVFTIAGVVVYSENSSLSIDQFPGTTYNNKSQAKTSANTTLPLPLFGASLGGRSTIWKNSGGGYSLSTIGVSTIMSIAQGSNATSTLNLTAGTGASFLAGYGVITASTVGASPYIGVVQSISTDALTVYPVLPFGISNSIYTYFKAGQSLAINASLNILSYSFGSTEINRTGFTNFYLDPVQNFMLWGNNIGSTFIDSQYKSIAWATAAGFLQCEGYFSAAEIEWSGMSFGVLSGTMIVNGLPVYSHANIGFTGTLRKTVFHEAGPGWNNFAFFPGSSHINVGISRINLYTRRHDLSASFGILAAFDTLQAYTARANNSTFLAPGVYKRTYGDQLLFTGPWVRAVGATFPGGVGYIGSTTTCKLAFQYYGTHFSAVGGASLGAGGSMTLSLDSGSNLGATAINTVSMGSSTTFHSVSLACLGGTNIISAMDFFRTTGEIKNLQVHQPFSVPKPTVQIPNIIRYATSGSYTYVQSPGVVFIVVEMVGGGGAGGSSGGSGSTGNSGTASVMAGVTANGGAGGVNGGSGGVGGSVTWTTGIVMIVAVAGGSGTGANSTAGSMQGSAGGNSAFGGAGGSIQGGNGGSGLDAAANSGSGGGGGGVLGTASYGAGGGAGAYARFLIPNPAGSYSVQVGAKGTANNGGANSNAGNGGDGLLVLTEYFNLGYV